MKPSDKQYELYRANFASSCRSTLPCIPLMQSRYASNLHSLYAFVHALSISSLTQFLDQNANPQPQHHTGLLGRHS